MRDFNKDIYLQRKRELKAERDRKRFDYKTKKRALSRRKPTLFEMVARSNGVIRLIVMLPKIFSIVNNPDETLKSFQVILSHVGNKTPIFLNASEVDSLSVDALLYLLAIFHELKYHGIPHSVRGNAPVNAYARKVFLESGFYEYVKTSGDWNSLGDDECIKIDSGSTANPSAAKAMCSFVIDKIDHTRNSAKGLYDLVFEIILNSTQHGYDRDKMHIKWFSYARYDNSTKECSFALLDTGYGIPRTVQKNFSEYVQTILSTLQIADSLDVQLVLSALRGEFRTQTVRHYRGKGMPKIREYCDSGYISKLTVVSGKAYVAHGVNKNLILHQPFAGTLYTWKMQKPLAQRT